jgi:hypothetical protein
MDTLVEPSKPQTVSRLQELEACLASMPQTEMPLEHFFTPGLYLRKIFMPAGTLVVSRRHKTEHPFMVLQGIADVFDEHGEFVERVKAPHVGVTNPGTLRILVIQDDSVWATAHVTDLTDPDEIVELITEHDNPVLPEGFIDAAFTNRKELPL